MRKNAFTKPSRGTSRARVELQSAETLSFRCCRERCHLSRGAAAFTLAEVLITLGIIGVVAVLTLPNLMSDYRKKTYVAQLQRVYNQIQNAAQNCMADEDVDNLNDTYLNIGSPWEDEDFDWEAQMGGLVENSAGRFLKKYFRVTKDCGYIDGDENDCLADSYKGIDGEASNSPAGYCVNVNTGATICMSPFDGYPAVFTVDTNGKLGPNTWGRDVFMFEMNYRGDFAESFDSTYMEGRGNDPDRCNAAGDLTYRAVGCFSKIIADGWKMDY